MILVPSPSASGYYFAITGIPRDPGLKLREDLSLARMHQHIWLKGELRLPRLAGVILLYLTRSGRSTIKYEARYPSVGRPELMEIKLHHFLLVGALYVMSTVNFTLSQDALGPQPKRVRAPEDYKPSTLKEIDSPDLQASSTVSLGTIHPYRVRATYIGVSRLITQSNKKALLRWTQCCAGDPGHYIKAYENELLFEEDGVQYWLPIPKQQLVIQHQFLSGDPVDLYLIKVATNRGRRDRSWALLVERFTDGDEPRSKERQESVRWIADKLGSYTARNITVETPEICQLRITEQGIQPRQKRVVLFTLGQLDSSTVKVNNSSSGNLSEMTFETESGKRSISFVIYDGNPAEAGQTNRYSLTFPERQKAEEMAQSFQRAIKVCTAASR